MIDLSEGGLAMALALEVDAPPSGTTVDLSIVRNGIDLPVRARIVATEPRDGVCVCRVAFVDLHPQDRTALLGWVHGT